MKSTKICAIYLFFLVLLLNLGCKNGEENFARTTTNKTVGSTQSESERFAHTKNTVVIATGIKQSDLFASEILWSEGKILGWIWNKGLGWRLFVSSDDVDESIKILEQAKRTGKLSKECLLVTSPVQEKMRENSDNPR